MEILLIRHGRTKGNLEGRYVGKTDEPILREEADRLMRSEYSRFCPDVVYTSALLRCRQTAECLFLHGKESTEINERRTAQAEKQYADHGAKLVICPGLNEMDFGIFEYKNYGELNGNPDYQRWIDSGGLSPIPDGEPGNAFRERCRKAFLECVTDGAARKVQRMAFVVHGGTIMSIMEAFAKPKRDFYDWQVKNGEGFLTVLRERSCGGALLELMEK